MPNPQIRVSVSQIKRYKRCARAWWYEYGPLKMRPPATKAAALGSAVHDILERYLLEGTDPPDNKAGRVASCGLEHLRDPSTLSIERSITLPLSENSTILCRIDMMGTDPGAAYIGDHKTTSDFKWALTRAEIPTDVQLLTYAMAAYHEDPPETVDVELVYYRTRGLPVSMVVGGTVSWESVTENWSALGEIAEDMAPKKTDPTGETCTPNTGACGDYGGCPHAVLCPFSPTNRDSQKNTLATVITGDYKGGASKKITTQAAPAVKKKVKTMLKNTPSTIQAAFGILPPDAAPQAEQTAILFVDTAAKLIDLLDLFEGPIPNAPARAFFVKEGIAVEEIPAVLKIAGAVLTPQGEIMIPTPDIFTPSPTQAPPAPTQAPPAVFAAKRCTVADQRRLGAELAQKVAATEGGLSLDDGRKWASLEISPSTLTEKRWGKIVEFSGLSLDGLWLRSDNTAGFTLDPETTDNTTATPTTAPPTTAPPAPQVENNAVNEHTYRGGPPVDAPAALRAPLVVLVDASFAVATVEAITLEAWLAPYIEQVEKMQGKPLWSLDLDYGKGDKFLAGVLSAASTSTGLIVASSTHPRIGVALSALSNQGAVIIYGR